MSHYIFIQIQSGVQTESVHRHTERELQFQWKDSHQYKTTPAHPAL